MNKKTLLKNALIIAILSIISIISVIIVSPKASSVEFHESSIKSLDDKKMTVMKLTVVSAATSTALAAIPGEATTPIANQIMDISSYLIIVLEAIFLEKILLTLTGQVTFCYIIPVVCGLFAINIFAKKDELRVIAIKLLIFGLLIFAIVPISIRASDLIETTYDTSIKRTLENAENIENMSNDETSDENSTEEKKSWLEEVTSKVNEVVTNVTDGVNAWKEKAEQFLSNLIDSIAILIITSCVMPILILIFFSWIIKMIFGINISIPKIKRKDNKKLEEAKKEIGD